MLSSLLDHAYGEHVTAFNKMLLLLHQLAHLDQRICSIGLLWHIDRCTFLGERVLLQFETHRVGGAAHWNIDWGRTCTHFFLRVSTSSNV
jgi:hypothetical protein